MARRAKQKGACDNMTQKAETMIGWGAVEGLANEAETLAGLAENIADAMRSGGSNPESYMSAVDILARILSEHVQKLRALYEPARLEIRASNGQAATAAK